MNPTGLTRVPFEYKEIPLTGFPIKRTLKIDVQPSAAVKDATADVLAVVVCAPAGGCGKKTDGSCNNESGCSGSCDDEEKKKTTTTTTKGLATVPEEVNLKTQGLAQELVKARKWKACLGSTLSSFLPSGGAVKEFLLVGFGDGKSEQYSILTGFDNNENPESVSPLRAFRAGAALAKALKETKRSSAAIYVDRAVVAQVVLEAFVRGLLSDLATDEKARFKGQTQEDSSPGCSFERIVLYVGASDDSKSAADLKAVVDAAIIVAEGENLTRELVDSPANCCNPETLGLLAKKLSEDHSSNLSIKLLHRKECEELGMGAYLAVNQGSMYEPNFIHITYKPDGGDVKKTIVLIGKGITMDTGGYNVKGQMMESMKFDMAGSAAVLGAAKIIAQVKPANIEIHFIIAAAENMISATAYRPGDVLTAANKKTIVVNNTDAEGRLTLADALVYAEKHVPKIDAIVDCATLTGACMVGLGLNVAAAYATDSNVMGRLLSSAQCTGTPLWPMPLYYEYNKLNKFPVADISNSASARWGGSITAALFLKQFVENKHWAHIDLAGPVFDTTSKFATGYGAKLLSDFAIKFTEEMDAGHMKCFLSAKP